MSTIALPWDLVEYRFKVFQRSIDPTLDDSALLNPGKYPSTNEYLDTLAIQCVKYEYSTMVFFCFQEISLEIVARIIRLGVTEQTVACLAKNIEFFNPIHSASITEFVKNWLETTVDTFSDLNCYLVATYRLLNHSDIFRTLVKVSYIMKIAYSDTLSANRYLAILILVKVLDWSAAKCQELIEKHVGFETTGPFAGKEIDYSFLHALEATRITSVLSLNSQLEKPRGPFFELEEEDTSPSVRIVYGMLVPVSSSLDLEEMSSPIVPVISAQRTLQSLTEKVLVGKPVLLYGGSGSGKSLLIKHLHHLLCDSDLTTIHLNEQTDVKLLIGTYVSSHEPGKFIWKDGVLTTAVKQGKWFVIEDIDCAKNEILSVFTSLIETGELAVNGSEKIRAKNGFQILSTITTPDEPLSKEKTSINENPDLFHYWDKFCFSKSFKLSKHEVSLPNLISLNKFQFIHHQAPSPSELLEILKHKYPSLNELFGSDLIWRKLIGLMYFLKLRTFPKRSFISMNNGLSLKKIDNLSLMKLTDRLNLLGPKASDLDNIFVEALDVYSANLQNHTVRSFLVEKIGNFLEVSQSQIVLQTDITKGARTKFLQGNNELIVGRSKIVIDEINEKYGKSVAESLDLFAFTDHSLKLLEKLCICVNLVEPVLLSGETGCGKTTIVQSFAKLVGKKIVVLNLSQETESNDLIGGYKPILNKAKASIVTLHNEFLILFGRTFNMLKNEKFVAIVAREFKTEKYHNVIKLWRKAIQMARNYLGKREKKKEDTPQKKRKLSSKPSLEEWASFEQSVFNCETELKSSTNSSFQFDFIEGSLLKAIRNGDWVLLDEINLASAETLENISDLLSDERKLLCTENASEENEIVFAHKEFRLFGCMNPSTDVGKKNLPENIRSRFTEIFVHSPDQNRNDLRSIVHQYLWKHFSGDDFTNNEVIDDVVKLYYEIKQLNDDNFLVDGSRNKIVVNIRVLSRALIFTTDIIRIYGVRRSLYEAFSMILLTILDHDSEKVLRPIIFNYTVGKAKNVKSILNRIPPRPAHLDESRAIQFSYYWLEKGEFDIVAQPNYIITPFVEKNLMNLVRATLTKRFPILIQGPTSSGKTSMINYLAKITGNKVIRINNHEHTDLQEYLGSYVSDSKTGKLVFKHGPLIEALKKGYWIILDELNLANSEILEGINRLLDDNREIFLTETQELIRPHKNFMLFATQNPPGAVYGGRKFLSKAFKNRFLELNFDDIPQDELQTILCNRCQIPPSYAAKIVSVYQELAVQRSSSRVFENKNSFATLRDLFRWGSREAVGYEQLAVNGYMLLAEKTRKSEEKEVIKNALEKVMKVKFDMTEIFETKFNEILPNISGDNSIVWTKEMKKLAVLIVDALKNRENILLVGETGCGKTTVCDSLAKFYFQQNLVFLNAHQNIETGDIIGSQRPLRNRSKLQLLLKEEIVKGLNSSGTFSEAVDLNELVDIYQEKKKEYSNESIKIIDELIKKINVLFEWSDGPLVTAMKNGDIFLFDEISLAEDSVLERLNSVLEPEKTLFLTEYSNDVDENLIVASKGFQFLATMNPGGDYGKKELSPALRNRFTEIYVASMSDFDDVSHIVESKLIDEAKHLTPSIIQFSKWFSARFSVDNSYSNNGVISIRDILAWVHFINRVWSSLGEKTALLDGVRMVFVDGLGTNHTSFLASNFERLSSVKQECINKLSEFSELELLDAHEPSVMVSEHKLIIGSYSLPRLPFEKKPKSLFNFEAPTTAMNAMRVLRAMVINKPVLLEGDPGVGKSSLVDAIAKATNNKLTRINLSDQTDLIDIFGSDAPIEGAGLGEFAWRDAPFLRAMKLGEWVLLDEMNLASPSLLEALNSVFDFRQKVYIPELDQEFDCHPDFRVFAAQNPQYQGGGRKGLPKSFVNRFSSVHVGKLGPKDMKLICCYMFPTVSEDHITKLIKFVGELEKEINVKKSWGQLGGPWEFNIRDIVKFLKIEHGNALDLVFTNKFRSEKDRSNVRNLYRRIFGVAPTDVFEFTNGLKSIQVNDVKFNKIKNTCFAKDNSLASLKCNAPLVESIINCVNHKFPVLLVGPTLSGKSELIRFVANIAGQKFETFHVHNEVDISDLVGGLDQYHINKELYPLFNDLLEDIKILLSIESDEKKAMKISNFLEFLMNLHSASSEDVLETLLENLPKIEIVIDSPEVHEIFEKLTTLKTMKNKQFKFFDGILIEALEKGYWLHLSNINLVDSSIVDRLNSLTESGGVLVVGENGSIDGSPKTIVPHPNFRLFLSMNPEYGELSRAMRNRCAEIYIESLEVRATEFDRAVMGIDGKSFASLLVSSKFHKNGIAASTLDVLRHSDPLLDGRMKVAKLVGSFLNFDHLDFTSRFLESLSKFDETESKIITQFVKFAQFLKSDNQFKLASSLVKSTNFIGLKALFDFFDLRELMDNSETLNPELYTFISEVYELLSFNLHSVKGEPYSEAFSKVCVCASMCFKITESERLNFMMEHLQYLILEMTEKYQLNNTLSALSQFEVKNSVSMTRLWNHFNLSSDLLEKLAEALPEEWRRFVNFEQKGGRLNDISLDLVKFQQINKVEMADSSIFKDDISSLLKIVEASRINDAALTNDYLMLCLKGGYNVISLSHYYIGRMLKPYPLFLEGVYDRWTLGSFPFVVQLTEKADQVQNVPGSLLHEAMSDLRYLEKELFLKSDIITSDQRLFYRQWLVKWVREIMIGQVKHNNILLSLLEETLSGKISHSAFCEALSSDIQLQRYTDYFQEFFTLLSGSVEDLGTAFVTLSVNLIRMYIPSAPYDPAICEYILYEIFCAQDKDAKEIEAGLKFVRMVLIGDSPLDIEKSVIFPDKVHVPRVTRPEKGTVQSLFNEWTSFVNSFCNGSVADLISGSDSQKVKLLNLSTTRFLHNLKENFNEYSDLNSVVKGCLLGLNFGFSLLQVEMADNIRCDAISSITHFGDFLKSNSNVNSILEAFGFLLNNNIQDSSHFSLVDNMLLSSFVKWKKERVDRENKEREGAATYKFKGEDEEEEDAYKSLFPDYEDYEDTVSREYFNPGDGPYISSIFIKVFALQEEKTIENVVDTIHEKPLELPSGSGTSTPSMICSLINKLWLKEQDFKDTGVDFYFQPNTYQFNICLGIVGDLLMEINKLLDDWPENATLQTIKNACEELRNFKASTPLARLIVKIDQIHKFLNELILYSNNINKKLMSSFVDRITSLIVSWRRIELGSFTNMIKNEHLAIQKKLVDDFYLLYELLIMSYASREKQFDEIVSLLSIFVSGSTQGEFLGKLDLLKAFSRYLKLGFEMETDLLDNLIQFFNLFAPSIQENIKSTKEKLEKDMNEVILLASWKDVNIDALRESSKKSRRALYKVVRKYRQALSVPVRPMIEEGLKFDISKDNKFEFDVIEVIGASLLQLNGELSCVKSWTAQPSMLLNLTSFIPKVKNIIELVEKEEFTTLYDFCESLIDEMERLRKTTPTKMTVENKKLVNALKSEKRLLLSETIKTLKFMGIKTRENQKYKLTASSIFAHSKSLAAFKFDDSLFYRLIDLIPRLKSAVVECVEDVPKDDVIKGLAMTEHLIFSIFSMREPMSKHLTFFNRIESQIDEIKLASSEKLVVKTSSLDKYEKMFANTVKLLPQFCGFVITTLNRCGKGNCYDLINSLAKLEAKVAEIASSYNSEGKCLLTFFKMEQFDKFALAWTEFLQNTEVISKTSPELTVFVEVLKDWIELDDFYSAKGIASEFKKFDITLLIDLSKSLTVALQKVKSSQSEPFETDSKGHFIKSQNRLNVYANSLYLEQISERFNKVLTMLQKTQCDDIVRSVLKYYLPLFVEYHRLSSVCIEKYCENYRDVVKSTYVLATALYRLSTKGFCSPQGSEEDENQDVDKGSGGGLDDGDTADSKTNDNIEEEDLDEDALTANKDQEENPDDVQEQDDDNAMDIDGDMEGVNEDMEGQDEDNDAEDLDEEIDDLDELDPNAVDEKMWDDEVDESKKEKDGDKLPQDSKADSDDLQANEDESNPTETGDSKEGDQQEEDNEEDNEEDEDDDGGVQDDNVVQDENNEQMDEQVDEADVLELPEDLNLDGDQDDKEESGDEKDDMADGLDDVQKMETDEQEEVDNNKEEDSKTDELEDAEKQEEEGSDKEGEANSEKEVEMNEEGEQNEEENGEEKEEVEKEDTENQSELEHDDENETDKSKKESGEDAANDDDKEDVEAVDAADTYMNEENADKDSGGKQATGEEEQGEEQNAEDNAAGTEGGFQHQEEQHSATKKSQSQQQKEKNDEKLTESLKQLGDSLQDFFKRSEEILNSSEIVEGEEEKSAENPDQLQHVEEKNDDDLQALGDAKNDQVQRFEEDNQINEEDEESPEHENDIVDDDTDMDADPEATKNQDLDVDMKEGRELKGEDQDVDMKDGESNEALDPKGASKQKADESEIEEVEPSDDEKEDQSDDAEDIYSKSEIIDLETNGKDYVPPLSLEEARELWQQSELTTNELSHVLCEQLRLILSPTVSTKFGGDFKSGKRLNLKKIISYIASDFKKDKIWLKRSRPSKRKYQIMISIDNSKSMSENPETVKLTYDTLCLVSKALTQLESGDLSIVKFGKDTSIIHNFNKRFEAKLDGPKSFQWFGFQDTVTKMKDLVENSIEIFNNSSSGSSDLYRLEIIISDGICENHTEIARLVRRAKEERILIVFVIIDGIGSKESITEMSQVRYEDDNGNLKMEIDNYLDTFPFENYTIVSDVYELPQMICEILRSFFMSSV